MRLWSVHPRFLDAKGLVAVWREGLLARAVLAGKTRGYRAHPQLQRFRERSNPLGAIDAYLRVVWVEACARGYRFDATKLGPPARGRFRVGRGQLAYEWSHLLAKLKRRDPARYATQRRTRPAPHPLFVVIRGGVATWERPAAHTPRTRIT